MQLWGSAHKDKQWQSLCPGALHSAWHAGVAWVRQHSMCRSMHGVDTVNVQVVDERMWGDEDKPEPDQKPGEEQRGKDAPAQVMSLRPC